MGGQLPIGGACAWVGLGGTARICRPAAALVATMLPNSTTGRPSESHSQALRVRALSGTVGKKERENGLSVASLELVSGAYSLYANSFA